MNLNKEQQKAVDHIDGYVRIIAGAGSGKTRVLVERIANILKRNEAFPSQILAITFTNKAAKELKERLTKSLESNDHIHAATFHSLCVRILREKELLLKLDRPFLIIDPDDQKTLVKGLIKEVFGKDTDIKPALAIAKISNYKNANLTPVAAEALAFTYFEKGFVDLYRRYNKYMNSQSLFDFDDLLIKTVQLFEIFPEEMENISRRYKYIHVDEYQDTNEIQSELLFYLACTHKNLCVVGDPDQSIYSWRGARPQILLNFDNTYENVETIYLSDNYRSTQKILSAANALISNNSKRLDNPLKAQVEGTLNPQFSFHEREENEMRHITQQINTLVDKGVEYNQIAILYRANYLSRYIEMGLIREAIPYQIFGNVQFYARKEIRDMLALLRFTVTFDDLSFLRIIQNLAKGIGIKTIENIQSFATINEMNLWSAFRTMKLSPRHNEVKDRLSKVISEAETIDVCSNPKEFFESLTKNSDIFLYQDDEDGSRKENILELQRVFCDYFMDISEGNLADFLTEAALFSENDRENESGAIKLMTVHMAKGLEFDYVFLPSFVADVFPSKKSVEESLEGIEEERRLAYVAMTRAKIGLYISGAKIGGYNYDFRMKSMFVNEMKLVEVSNRKPSINIAKNRFEQKGQKENSNVIYYLGDKIIHELFGDGTIVGIDGTLFRVAFVGKGIKVLSLPHKLVKKQ